MYVFSFRLWKYGQIISFYSSKYAARVPDLTSLAADCSTVIFSIKVTKKMAPSNFNSTTIWVLVSFMANIEPSVSFLCLIYRGQTLFGDPP